MNSRAQDRRTRLLNAAAHVFAARGVEAATIAEITQRAAVAKGSFYLEFSSKEQAVTALQERHIDRLLANATSIYDRLGEQDLWSLALEFVDAMIDFDLDNRRLVAVIARRAGDLGGDPCAPADRRLQDMIATGIKVGVAAGDFTVEDPELTAGLLMHAIHGVLRDSILDEGEVDRDRLVAAARALMTKALGPAPTSVQATAAQRNEARRSRK